MKEERISLMEQSLAYIAKCMEAMQIQASTPPPLQLTYTPFESPSGSEHRLTLGAFSLRQLRVLTALWYMLGLDILCSS